MSTVIPYAGRTFMFCDVCGDRWISNVPVCLSCLTKYDVTPSEIIDALGPRADFKKLELLLNDRRKGETDK